MEINKEVYIEQETVGSFKEITSSIRAEDLGMALDAVSRNLYSNPIGSFVRELVSNGVDANRKSNSAELVKVNVYKEGSTWYFQVQDEGLGMSPEHFTEVYMRWFNSDKRDNNEDIGGWGIGSKSPLSYQESYELTTVADGIEYEYIIVRQSPAPTATLLAQRETGKRSGTTVRVEILEADLFKLSKEIEKQLSYFNNVIVINEYYYYDNHFKIIESDLFKARDKEQPFGDNMHIVLGQVAYPIDWNILNMSPVRVPVGIKFEIGDLPVTLSREGIKYNDDGVKDLIRHKIEEVYADLLERYNKSFITDDLIKYLSLFLNDRNTLELTDDVTIPFYLRDKTNVKRILKANGKEYRITKDNISEIFRLFNVSELYNTSVVHSRTVNIRDLVYSTSSYYYRTDDFNHWSNMYRENGMILNKRKITKGLFLDIATILKLTYTKRTTRYTNKEYLKIGAFREVYEFIKYIDNYFKAKLQSYDDVPEAFIKMKKDAQKLLEEERKGNITTYSLLNEKTNIKLESLLDDYKYVFYIDKNDNPEKVAHYYALFELLPEHFKSQYKFIIVSSTVIKRIKKYKDVMKSVEKLWLVANLYGFFNNIRYRYLLSQYDYSPRIDYVSDYYYKLLKFVDKKVAHIFLSSIITNYTKKVTIYKEDGSPEYTVLNVSIDLCKYFSKEFEKVRTKKEDILIASSIEEYSKVAYILTLLVSLDKRDPKDQVKIKSIIKMYKLTKLNPIYYGI